MAGTATSSKRVPHERQHHDAISREEPVLQVAQRYRAPGLLIFGAGSLIPAFAVVTSIGVIDFNVQLKNTAYDHAYPSGNGYWPSTVSEMVHNAESPGGKVFYTFGLIAGACIFLSMYPFHLRNVYTGQERFLNTSMYWTTFRQLIPAMGIWLLIGINTYPTQEALESHGYTKLFCVALHLAGAGMLFIGYMLCELKTLGISCGGIGFKLPKDKVYIEGTERRVRKTLAWIIVAGFFGFCSCQGILVVFKKKMCCGDEWKHVGELVNSTDLSSRRIRGAPQIWDTASGTYLLVKVLSFVCEDIAGFSMVLSHIAVWYYCEERHVEYGEEKLQEVYIQDDPDHPHVAPP